MSDLIKDWELETDEYGVLWLKLDKKDSDTNVLSSSVLNQLEILVKQIINEKPKAVIFQTGKKSGFIAGADVKEFLEVTSQQEALIMIKRGQMVFSQIESLPCPTVALIEGFCMGGGTELILSCDYRVALNETSTKIGLPEIKLGLHPAFGGVVRLTAIINPLKSLEMMLSGQPLGSQQARLIGLVDLVQPRRQIKRAALAMALKKPPKRKMPLMGKVLSLPGIRHLLVRFLKIKVSQKASKRHYPAPYALLDVWCKYYGNKKRMMEEEANSVARLVQGNTVQNLIRVFFLQAELKALGDKKAFTSKNIHVIGAGIMGGDIAAWCALSGLYVTLQDREPKYLSNAIKRAHKLFTKTFKTIHERNAALDRLIPDCNGYGVAKADIIIEAIIEDKAAKQAIYTDLEPRMKKGAILATNTSSIPLETLAETLQDPQRLIGIHFFNPVAMMPLVEVVKTEFSSKKAIQKAIAFTLHIGKLPLPVKSSPGFLVNRILMPYLVEAIILYEEGVSLEAIDKAAVDFGMPMGPIELADTVGIDICHSVAKNLAEAFGIMIPAGLDRYISENNLGKKTGRGFYLYKNGRPIKNQDADLGDQTMIQNRLVLRLLNEAAACLDEKIVDNKNLLDAGIIFGAGFAPFRGGPINYSDQRSANDLIQIMVQYGQQYGERFNPVPGWDIIKKISPKTI